MLVSLRDESLTLKFDPLTIEHLGYKMYSHLPNALAELIANAYDADASLVRIVLSHRDGERTVRVEDDGHGMSLNDLNSKYLLIGRNRRIEGSWKSESGRRHVGGKKGLGKLALFGIGESIEILTKRAGASAAARVNLNWADILTATGNVYHPQLHQEKAPVAWHGTVVELKKLRRKTDVMAKDLAVSLGRLFNYADDSFRVEVVSSEGASYPIDRISRLDAIENDKEWVVPDSLPSDLVALMPDAGIRGRVLAAAKPVSADSRGIALYAHGRLANEPEFFGVSESSFAFSYLTGYLDVDYIDNLNADVISTDRRSVSWDSPEMSELRTFLQHFLQWISRDRREARRRANAERIVHKHNVSLEAWVDTIQGPERNAVRSAAEVLTSPDSAMADADRDSLLESLRAIAPDYADMHWRHLHPVVRNASEVHYRAGLYHSALSEALKRYVNDVRRAGDLGGTAANIIDAAFGGKPPRLDVTRPFGAQKFDENTIVSICKGQHSLSAGVVAAFRNTMAHEAEARLIESGALSHRDCLDGLSIVSHLYERFERGLTEEQRRKLTLST